MVSPVSRRKIARAPRQGRLLAVGCWLLVVGCWLLTVGCWCGFCLESGQILGGLWMESVWILSGLCVESVWALCGFWVDSGWILGELPPPRVVEPIWGLGQWRWQCPCALHFALEKRAKSPTPVGDLVGDFALENSHPWSVSSFEACFLSVNVGFRAQGLRFSGLVPRGPRLLWRSGHRLWGPGIGSIMTFLSYISLLVELPPPRVVEPVGAWASGDDSVHVYYTSRWKNARSHRPPVGDLVGDFALANSHFWSVSSCGLDF